jgi:hypothetical protein
VGKKRKSLNSVLIYILCAVVQLRHKHRRQFKFLIVLVAEVSKIFNLFLQKNCLFSYSLRCLELSSQNNRLICVSPGLRSSISGGPRASPSLQSSKSGEARAYPSVMAPPPVSAIFHEKFQTFCFILNYSLQIYFAISLENLCYIKIPDRTESWLSCLRKHARFSTILLRSISHRKLWKGMMGKGRKEKYRKE